MISPEVIPKVVYPCHFWIQLPTTCASGHKYIYFIQCIMIRATCVTKCHDRCIYIYLTIYILEVILPISFLFLTAISRVQPIMLYFQPDQNSEQYFLGRFCHNILAMCLFFSGLKVTPISHLRWRNASQQILAQDVLFYKGMVRGFNPHNMLYKLYSVSIQHSHIHLFPKRELGHK